MVIAFQLRSSKKASYRNEIINDFRFVDFRILQQVFLSVQLLVTIYFFFVIDFLIHYMVWYGIFCITYRFRIRITLGLAMVLWSMVLCDYNVCDENFWQI